MYNHKLQKGYSLIEVMIAVAILMLAIVAPMTIAVKSIQSSRYTLEQNTATFLAQESISIIEALRNHYSLESINANDGRHWEWTDGFEDCRTSYGCNFDATDPYTLIDYRNNIIACDDDGENCRLMYNATWNRSNYRISDNSGEPSPFIRRVFFENLNDHELRVRVEVEWDSGFLGQEQRVTMASSFFNLYGTLGLDGSDAEGGR